MTFRGGIPGGVSPTSPQHPTSPGEGGGEINVIFNKSRHESHTPNYTRWSRRRFESMHDLIRRLALGIASDGDFREFFSRTTSAGLPRQSFRPPPPPPRNEVITGTGAPGAIISRYFLLSKTKHANGVIKRQFIFIPTNCDSNPRNLYIYTQLVDRRLSRGAWNRHCRFFSFFLMYIIKFH